MKNIFQQQFTMAYQVRICSIIIGIKNENNQQYEWITRTYNIMIKSNTWVFGELHLTITKDNLTTLTLSGFTLMNKKEVKKHMQTIFLAEWSIILGINSF